MSAVAFDMSELHGIYTERSMVDEATRPETIRKGNYNGVIATVDPRRASEKSPFANRMMLNLRAGLDVDGKTVTKFVEVSPEIRRVRNVAGEKTWLGPKDADYSKEYPLDNNSKLWGMIEKIVNPQGKYSVEEVASDLVDRAFRFYVSEPFVDEEGNYHSYKTEEERAELVKAGYTPRNFINSISPVKN